MFYNILKRLSYSHQLMCVLYLCGINIFKDYITLNYINYYHILDYLINFETIHKIKINVFLPLPRLRSQTTNAALNRECHPQSAMLLRAMPKSCKSIMRKQHLCSNIPSSKHITRRFRIDLVYVRVCMFLLVHSNVIKH